MSLQFVIYYEVKRNGKIKIYSLFKIIYQIEKFCDVKKYQCQCIDS